MSDNNNLFHKLDKIQESVQNLIDQDKSLSDKENQDECVIYKEVGKKYIEHENEKNRIINFAKLATKKVSCTLSDYELLDKQEKYLNFTLILYGLVLFYGVLILIVNNLPDGFLVLFLCLLKGNYDLNTYSIMKTLKKEMTLNDLLSTNLVKVFCFNNINLHYFVFNQSKGVSVLNFIFWTLIVLKAIALIVLGYMFFGIVALTLTIVKLVFLKDKYVKFATMYNVYYEYEKIKISDVELYKLLLKFK